MGIKFNIHYNENPFAMYFAGQIVMGKAIIELEQAIRVKSIKLKVCGYSGVRWEEKPNKNNSNSHAYSDEDEYFNASTECIDTKGHEFTLGPGTYTYNFECPLPADCPTSFEGSYGRIRYETKITVIRPRNFNKSYSSGFSVQNKLNLNRLPDLRIHAQMDLSKTFCCGPCKSRPLFLSMDIPQTAYVPGEFINVNIKLANHSSTKVEHIKVALNLIALYSVSTTTSTKTEKIAIAERTFLGFEESNFEVNDKLQVPPTPPTCVDLCRIITITYEVEVIARVKGAHISPAVSIPIVIGNIPYASAPDPDDMENNPVTPGLQINFSAELPPPSYEEALFMQPLHPIILQSDENPDTQSENFTPRYPFYGVQVPVAITHDNCV